MSLDIMLLIATIVVAVAAVIASLLQAVIESRRSGRRGPRKVDARRLARALPPPVRVDAAAPSRALAAARLEAQQASLVEARPAEAPAAEAPATEAPAADVSPLEAAPAEAPAADALPPDPVMASSMEAEPEPDPTPVSVPDIEVATPAVMAKPSTEASQEDQAALDDRAAPAAAASLPVIAASAPATWRATGSATTDDTIHEELAYRIGVTGVQRPERPAVIVVADGERRTGFLPASVGTEVWPDPPRRRRRAAFRIAAVAAALAWVMTAVVVLPDLTQQGGVLGETGRPQASGDPGLGSLQTPAPTPALTADATEPSTSPPPEGTPAPTVTPTPSLTAAPSSASTGTGQVAEASLRPSDAAPAPTPPRSLAPTVQPTGSPTPSRVHAPVATFKCTVEVLTLTCDASVTSETTSYLWDFSEGDTVSAAHASYTFLRPGQYLVMLTVTNAWGSRSSAQPFTIG